jgi:hypothetical protein
MINKIQEVNKMGANASKSWSEFRVGAHFRLKDDLCYVKSKAGSGLTAGLFYSKKQIENEIITVHKAGEVFRLDAKGGVTTLTALKGGDSIEIWRIGYSDTVEAEMFEEISNEEAKQFVVDEEMPA